MISCRLYLCKPGIPNDFHGPGWSDIMDGLSGSLGIDDLTSIKYIRLNGWSYLPHWVIELKEREREGVSE